MVLFGTILRRFPLCYLLGVSPFQYLFLIWGVILVKLSSDAFALRKPSNFGNR